MSENIAAPVRKPKALRTLYENGDRSPEIVEANRAYHREWMRRHREEKRQARMTPE